MMRKGKKSIVLFMTSLLLIGNISTPMNATATESETTTTFGKEEVKDEVVYDAIAYDVFKDLIGVEAPTKSGYYFGGWYEDAPGDGETDADCTAIKTLESVADKELETVYAKFVPNYIMNVKAQNLAAIDTSDGTWETDPEYSVKNDIRMVAGIDSARYKEVGFHVFVAGNRMMAKTTTKYNRTIYCQIVAVDSEGKQAGVYTAKDLFGLEAENYEPKLITAKFTNIPQTGWKTSIFVRPYWITYDGIEVRGNGRYIHVEDGIKGYVTVPVNVQGITDKTDEEGYVAGTIDVMYDPNKLTFVDTIENNSDDGYKKGVDLNIMAVKDHPKSTKPKIKCAAIRKDSDGTMLNIVPNQYAASKRSVDDIFSDEFKDAASNSYEVVNNMYVTLRFKKNEDYTGTDNKFYEFYINNAKFCDTEENLVTTELWDVRY